MSRVLVHAGRRRSFTPTVINVAGDLVYQNGFYGYVDDTTVVGRLATLILEGVGEFKNVIGSNIPPGAKAFAAPSVTASTLAIYASAGGAIPSGVVAIGRVWATSPASSATATIKVQLFNPNQY